MLHEVTDEEQARIWREALDRRQKIQQRASASLWQELRQFFAGKMKLFRRAYVSHIRKFIVHRHSRWTVVPITRLTLHYYRYSSFFYGYKELERRRL